MAAPVEGLQSEAAWIAFHEDDAYLRPAATFDGDENITSESYATCMTDNWYTQTTPRFVAAAASFGVPITAKGYEREKRVLSAACWIDDWLDSDQTDMSARFEGYETIVRSALTGSLDEAGQVVRDLTDNARVITAIDLLANSVRPLSDIQREWLAHLGLSIGHLGRQKTLTSDAAQYRFLALGEGYYTGVLFADALTADMPETYATRSYRDWMGKSLGYFTLRDSRQDLAEDFTEGRTQVRPTLGAKLTLAVGEAALIPDIALVEPGRSASKAMKGIKARLELPDTH